MKKALLFLIIGSLISWFASKIYHSENIENIEDQTDLLENIKEQDSIISSLSIEIGRLKSEKDKSEKEQVLFKTETSVLTNQELSFLKNVRKFHSEIEIPKKVTRSYVYGVDKYRLISTEFNYDKNENGLILDGFVYYNISLKKQNGSQFEYLLEYNLSMGKALVADGFITQNSMNNEVIKVEYSFGTGAGTSEITVNGEKKHSNLEDFETN